MGAACTSPLIAAAKCIEPAIRMSYYEVLQVAEEASPNEIRAAYLRLVQRHHPDRHVGEATEADHDTFKQIQEAYEVLFDAEQRRLYDNQRSIPKPRDRGPVVTPAYRASAAATQPINPAVRRDVPDDWLRRGGSSGTKKKPIRTLVFVAILIGLATTVVPQCSQYMEQHIGMEEVTIPEFNSALGPQRSSLPTMTLFSPSLERDSGKENVVDLDLDEIENGERVAATEQDESDENSLDRSPFGDSHEDTLDADAEQPREKEASPFQFSIDETVISIPEVDLDEIRSKSDRLLAEGLEGTNSIGQIGFAGSTTETSSTYQGRSHSPRRRSFQFEEGSQGFGNELYRAPATGNLIAPPTWYETIKPLSNSWGHLSPKTPTKNPLLPTTAPVDMSLPLMGQQNSFNDPGTHAWNRDSSAGQGVSNSWDHTATGNGWSGGNVNSPKTATWGSMQNQSASAAVARFGATGVAPPAPPVSFPVNGAGFSNAPALPSGGGFSTPTPWR